MPPLASSAAATTARIPPESVPAPFPAKTRQSQKTINGIPTECTSIQFADKLFITITQNGRIAQWLHTPLDTPYPTLLDGRLLSSEQDEDVLPITHLTPTTLFGGSNPERESLGQLYAVQIASAIALRYSGESRGVTVGLGLVREWDGEDREGFMGVMELVGECL